MTPPTTTVPWRPGDLTLLCALTAIGLMGVIAGWFGASGSTDVRTEEVWLAAAIMAAVVTGMGNALWLLAGHRSIRVRARAATAEMTTLLLPLAAVDPVSVELPTREEFTLPIPVDGALVATDTMVHFHTRECHLATGKAVVADTAAGHDRAGRRPCGVCRPLGPTETNRVRR